MSVRRGGGDNFTEEIMTSTTPTGSTTPEFTPRQLEVLRLIAQGLMNKEIAGKLGIKESTVVYHVGKILEKLGVDSKTKAALWAQAHGFGQPNE